MARRDVLLERRREAVLRASSRLAHDVNNALSIIATSVGQFRAGGAAATETCDEVLAAVQRAESLVRQCSALTDLAGHPPHGELRSVVFAIDRLIRYVSDQRVTVRIADPEPRMIADALGLLLVDLALSIAHRTRRGTIQVSLSFGEDAAELTLSIPAGGEPPTAKLALALRARVRALGGVLAVQRTRCQLRVPRALVSELVEVTVLVVHHDATRAAATAALLGEHGLKTVTASAPADALAIVENRALAVVVTDLALRGMSGAHLARCIGVTRPAMPVVFTADSAEEAARHGIPVGSVSLGSDPAALVERVRTASAAHDS